MESEVSNRRVAAALIAGVVAISFAAIFFRNAEPTHPLVMAAFRLLLAAALLSFFVVRAHFRRSIDARFVRHACLGGVFYAAHFGCWIWSLSLTSVAAAVTLVTATPLLLAVWAMVTGVDRPGPKLWLSLGLAAIGVVTIGGGDFSLSSTALVGDALAFAGAGAMAGYMLVVRPLGPIDVFAFTGIATLVGGVILTALAALTGVLAVPEPHALAWLSLAALIPQLVGHSSLTWALRHVRPTTVGIATLAEPVGATLLAWWLLAELPGTTQLIGCAITIGAVALALRARGGAET